MSIQNPISNTEYRELTIEHEYEYERESGEPLENVTIQVVRKPATMTMITLRRLGLLRRQA